MQHADDLANRESFGFWCVCVRASVVVGALSARCAPDRTPSNEWRLLDLGQKSASNDALMTRSTSDGLTPLVCHVSSVDWSIDRSSSVVVVVLFSCCSRNGRLRAACLCICRARSSTRSKSCCGRTPRTAPCSTPVAWRGSCRHAATRAPALRLLSVGRLVAPLAAGGQARRRFAPSQNRAGQESRRQRERRRRGQRRHRRGRRRRGSRRRRRRRRCRCRRRRRRRRRDRRQRKRRQI